MTEWLTAFDEMYYFMQIFYDNDTTYSLQDDAGTTKVDNYYGFADPDKQIFRSYNITRFQPEVHAQLPGIQIVIDDQRAHPDSSEKMFGTDTEVELSLYLISEKRQTLQYNGETYYIEDINTPKPHENDLIMLMRAFVFQRLYDFRGFTSSDISWGVLDWTGSEYIVGLGGVDDLVALRLIFKVEFQMES
jgi:hypothetical protein